MIIINDIDDYINLSPELPVANWKRQLNLSS